MRNLAILLVLLWSTAAGAVPNTINFTGRLSTSTGPVTGSVDITLRLFPSADGGTQLWSEVQRGVGADNGLVFLELGKQTTLDENVLDGRQLFLEIVIGSEKLAPRLPLNSVPYAVRTETAATADLLGGSIAAGDVVTQVNGGAGVVATKSGNGVSVSLTSCTSNGQILKWSGSQWACGADNGTTYTTPSGSGIALTSSTIALTSCTSNGQILKWSGTQWACGTDSDTAPTATAPLAVSNNVVSLSGANCTTGQVLKWNATTSTWACGSDFTTTSCVWKVAIGPTQSGTELSVSCPTGQNPISGGCSAANSTIAVVASRPGGPPPDGTPVTTPTQWTCDFATASTVHRAFALCCNTI